MTSLGVVRLVSAVGSRGQGRTRVPSLTVIGPTSFANRSSESTLRGVRIPSTPYLNSEVSPCPLP